MDKAHEYTDRELELMGRKIDAIYKVQNKVVVKMAEKYFSQFEDVDNKKKQELEDGKITKAEYKNWRIATMMTGKKWNEFIHSLCKVIHRTNQRAIDISNNATIDVFVENYNFVGKSIEEQVHGL